MNRNFEDSFSSSILDISFVDPYFFFVPARLVCDSMADDFLAKESDVE